MLTEKTIEHFINGLYAEKKSPNTITIYRYNLKLFTDAARVAKLNDITPQIVRSFLAQRAQTTKSATVHQAFRVLRTFFRWCLAEGLLERNPLANIKPPRLESKIIETFTVEDIRRLLAACRQKTFIGERNRAVISCLLDSGMRAEEMIRLSINDVDYRSGIIKVRGKGNKERLASLGTRARQHLWRYLLIRDVRAPREQVRLFLSEEVQPLTRGGLTCIISKLGKRAGVVNTRCSPHTFRHTFAVQYLRNGGNIADLRILGGWADLDSLKPYLASASQRGALESHQQFSPGDRML